ncbi:MAG TPA: lysylphosphatidylglycerol synthase transmembrane domain-containing protein [Gemmatimonadales bacterium]|nr:lysylphosphatidylglycerol synthase transmembrane domain-containing protein [Gemmatimonadales bacterium]
MKLGVRAGLVTGVLLLCVVVVVAVRFGKPEEFAKLLERARPAWLLLALLFQAGTYVCAGAVWQRALAHQNHHRSLLQMVRLGVVKVFMDQALPSAGLSGNVLVARGLGHRGMSHQSAVATVLAGLISFYIANGIAIAAALAILWINGRVSRLVTILATVFAIVIGVFLWGLLWITQDRKRIPRWMSKIKPLERFFAGIGEHPPHVMRDVGFFVEGTVLQLALIALDAATLWAVLQAMGTTVSAAAAFTSFTMASVVAMMSLLPGGLGTFDGTAIAMLRAFHVPLEAAVAGTVLLRGLTFILPLIPGFWLARAEAVK